MTEGIQTGRALEEGALNSDVERRTRRFRAFLIFAGSFNIALAAPLTAPQLYTHYLGFLWAINEWLNLGGQAPAPPPGGVHALLINTAGIDLVLIGVFVLYAAGNPLSRWFIPAVNAAARSLFACLILYYVAVYDIARIVLVIGVVDLLISCVFAYYLLRLRASLAAGPAAARQSLQADRPAAGEPPASAPHEALPG
jgi:hypothetical protein